MPKIVPRVLLSLMIAVFHAYLTTIYIKELVLTPVLNIISKILNLENVKYAMINASNVMPTAKINVILALRDFSLPKMDTALRRVLLAFILKDNFVKTVT